MSISDIKDIIRNRRLELGLTMKEVADAVGVSEGTVSRWEAGNISNMKRNRIAALAKILDISPTVIMGFDDNAQDEDYYSDPEVAEMANAIHKDPELRILFKASKRLKKEDLQTVINLVNAIKKENE